MADQATSRRRSRPRRLPSWQLPTKTAVYRVLAYDSRLLYVGVATDPRKRLTQHARSKTWWPAASHADIEWYPDRLTAEDEELRSIRVDHPAFNIQGTGGPLQRRPTPSRQVPECTERIRVPDGA